MSYLGISGQIIATKPPVGHLKWWFSNGIGILVICPRIISDDQVLGLVPGPATARDFTRPEAVAELATAYGTLAAIPNATLLRAMWPH